MFGFLIQFPFLGINTRWISMLIALITLSIRRKELKDYWALINKRNYNRFLYFTLACALISLYQLLEVSVPNGDTYTRQIQLLHFVYLYLYVFVFSLYCLIVFKSLKDFALIWLAIIITEALSVFLAIASPAVNFVFYSLFSGDSRFDLQVTVGTRIFGLGIFASYGSIVLSTGCILLVLIWKRLLLSNIPFIILLALIVVATLFIGRTGVIIEIITLGIGIMLTKRMGGLFSILFIAFVVLNALSLIFDTMDATIVDNFQEWMMGGFDSERRSNTIEGIAGTGFPPFSSEMLLGLGVMRGLDSHGIFHITDSGYIMVYSAIGVIGFVVYYLSIINLLLVPKRKFYKSERLFFFLLIIIGFVIEYKEIYSMKYIYTWFILTIMLITARDNRNQIRKGAL